MNTRYDIQPVDAHLHMSLCRRMSRYCNVQQMFDILDNCGIDAINIQNITLWHARNLVRNPLSMLAKALRPANVYSFGGPRIAPPENTKKDMDYVGQVKELTDIGFDGIKLFGKPDMRHELGEPFDSPLFDDMFGYLEEKQIPTLFHVGDPLSFWDREKIPQFAVKNGWYYDESFEPAEQLYSEIDNVMARHPKLNIIYPHVYFLSDDLDRLGAFLDRWENAKTDITPGIEMYDSFTANADKTREFFIHYGKKIFFGTDNTGNAANQEGEDYIARSAGVIRTLREFLETDGSVKSFWGAELKGISLPLEIIRFIYQDNFYALAGRKPKPVDISKAAAYAEEQLFEGRARREEHPEVVPELEQTFDHLKRLALGEKETIKTGRSMEAALKRETL